MPENVQIAVLVLFIGEGC